MQPNLFDTNSARPTSSRINASRTAMRPNAPATSSNVLNRSSNGTNPPPSSTQSQPIQSVMTSLSETAKASTKALQNIDLKILDPTRINWEKLKITTIKEMSSPYIIFIIISCILVVFLLCFIIYKIKNWYQTNANDYPVLLTLPVRGALYTHDLSTINKTTYYVLDREGVNYDGLKLPYPGNELSFLTEPKLMPELNNQVQFTVNFWMKIENYGQLSTGADKNYSILLAHNYTSVGQFQVCYDNNTNTIVVLVEITTPGGNPKTETYSVPNILLIQRWQMITIVLDNRDLDVYYNNTLSRSFHLNNVPELGVVNDWVLYPGKNEFVGLVSCVRYFDYAFNMNEVYRLHLWQKGEHPPQTSYYFWWTWYKGNTISSVYKTLVKDSNDFVKYSTFGVISKV